MSDHAGFLDAIIEDPDDDAPRLAYADALELGDAGFPAEPARGEFIRLQCELAKPDADILPGDDGPLLPLIRRTEAQRDALRRRERDLLKAHGQVWNAPVYKALNADRFATPAEPERHLSWEFHRGFVSRLTLTWQDWQTHSAELLAACPIARAADGLVRLTTWPPVEQRGECGYSLIVSGTLASGRQQGITRDDGDADGACLQLLAAEWPGVTFQLPAADDRGNIFRNVRFVPDVHNPSDNFAGRVDG